MMKVVSEEIQTSFSRTSWSWTDVESELFEAHTDLRRKGFGRREDVGVTMK